MRRARATCAIDDDSAAWIEKEQLNRGLPLRNYSEIRYTILDDE